MLNDIKAFADWSCKCLRYWSHLESRKRQHESICTGEIEIDFNLLTQQAESKLIDIDATFRCKAFSFLIHFTWLDSLLALYEHALWLTWKKVISEVGEEVSEREWRDFSKFSSREPRMIARHSQYYVINTSNITIFSAHFASTTQVYS